MVILTSKIRQLSLVVFMLLMLFGAGYIQQYHAENRLIIADKNIIWLFFLTLISITLWIITTQNEVISLPFVTILILFFTPLFRNIHLYTIIKITKHVHSKGTNIALLLDISNSHFFQDRSAFDINNFMLKLAIKTPHETEICNIVNGTNIKIIAAKIYLYDSLFLDYINILQVIKANRLLDHEKSLFAANKHLIQLIASLFSLSLTTRLTKAHSALSAPL